MLRTTSWIAAAKHDQYSGQIGTTNEADIRWWDGGVALQCFGSTLAQESPPIGGAVWNATSLIPQRLSSTIVAITCSKNVHVEPCIDSHGRVDHDNNTTPDTSVHCAWSAFNHFRLWWKLFMASLQPVDVLSNLPSWHFNFVDLQPAGWNLTGVLFDPGLGDRVAKSSKSWFCKSKSEIRNHQMENNKQYQRPNSMQKIPGKTWHDLRWHQLLHKID